jgi:hypothetical protein
VRAADIAFFNGFLDEVRVEKESRSQQWIRSQYNSMMGEFVEFRDLEEAL